MQKNCNELKHVLVHVIINVIHFNRDWKEMLGSLGNYTILCWSSDAPPPSVLRKFKFLDSSIVQVYVIAYQTWCCQCVSSQLDTHIAEVLAGVTLSVNAFEFWHARGPSRLARLDKDLTCAPASQAYVERTFSVCALLNSWRRRSMFKCLEMSVCLKLDSAGRNVLPTVTVFQRLGVNDTDLM